MPKPGLKVTNTMHYTVVIALVISLITTFLLGMLITDRLFGTGMSYFAFVGETSKVKGVSAAQSSSDATQLRPARPDMYLATWTGLVDHKYDPSGSVDDIDLGNKVVFQYLFDANAEDIQANTDNAGIYRFTGDVKTTFPGREFIGTTDYDIFVTDFSEVDPNTASSARDKYRVNFDSFISDDAQIWYAWLNLYDWNGSAFQSDELPLEIDLDEFDDYAYDWKKLQFNGRVPGIPSTSWMLSVDFETVKMESVPKVYTLQ